MKLPIASFRRLAMVLVVGAITSGCAGPQTASGINDPHEATNREIHKANLVLDRMLLDPASEVAGTVIPKPIRQGVSNFSENLSIPGTVVNDLLQLNIGDAAHNTMRFLFNTTLGLGGLINMSQEAGMEARPSDFGETLYVWGVREGAYVELPVFGPSTSRAVLGRAVDLFLDPFGYITSTPEKYIKPGTGVFSTVEDRYRYASTVESILYESADSYAQARLLYLENRRYNLGQAVETDDDEQYEGLYDDFLTE